MRSPLLAPGVRVGVEVDQRQRPVLAVQRAQDRVADVVVATQGERHHALGDDARIGRGDRRGHVAGMAVVDQEVAMVDHGEALEGIEAPGVGRRPRQRGRGGAHRPRAEARARAVGGGEVEGHPDHRHVDAVQILAVAAAHEAGDARPRGLRQRAAIRLAHQREVGADGRVAVACGHGPVSAARRAMPGAGRARPAPANPPAH